MYANVYEMKMPTNYVDMNTSELEYTGEGLLGNLFRDLANLGTMFGLGSGYSDVCEKLSYLDPVNALGRMIYETFGREKINYA